MFAFEINALQCGASTAVCLIFNSPVNIYIKMVLFGAIHSENIAVLNGNFKLQCRQYRHIENGIPSICAVEKALESIQSQILAIDHHAT